MLTAFLSLVISAKFSSTFCFSTFWAIFARKTDPSGKVNFIEQLAQGLCRGLLLAKFSSQPPPACEQTSKPVWELKFEHFLLSTFYWI